MEDMALVTIDHFFNEEELELHRSVESGGEGIYKITESLEGGFTAIEKIESVPEGLTTDEEGRIIVEGETDRVHYVHFIIPE